MDFPFARPQAAERPRADAHAHEPQGRVTGGGGHAADLAVAAFGERDFQPEEGLAVYLADNCDAWDLAAEGTWTRVVPRRGARRRSAQTQLLERLRKPSQGD